MILILFFKKIQYLYEQKNIQIQFLIKKIKIINKTLNVYTKYIDIL